MCRLTFTAIAALATIAGLSPLEGQQLPARDLFQFPIGTLAEAPALAASAGGGFWNPATIAIGPGYATRVSVSALNSPIEQGVFSLLATASRRLRPGLTAGIGIANATVGDLVRTETDPLSRGDIPYRSTIASAEFALERGSAVVGLAIRSRSARVDLASGHATSIDFGTVLTRPAGLPLRAALSTFLLAPGSSIERSSIVGAVEGYIPGTRYDLRSGLSWQHDQGHGDEAYVYGAGQVGLLDLRGGLARYSSFSTSSTRIRLGVGVRYAHYRVGIAREDGISGLGASYQFLLTTAFP